MEGHSLTKEPGGILNRGLLNIKKPLLVTEKEAEWLGNVAWREELEESCRIAKERDKKTKAFSSLIDVNLGIEKPKSQQKLHDIIDTIFRNVRQFEVVIHVTIITTVLSNIIIEPQLIKAIPLALILPIRGLAYLIKK